VFFNPQPIITTHAALPLPPHPPTSPLPPAAPATPAALAAPAAPAAPAANQLHNNEVIVAQAPAATAEELDPVPIEHDPARTWVAYMDGSFTRLDPVRSSRAAWGVVIVTNGGLAGATEDEGDVVQELGGKVAVNAGKYFLQNKKGVRSNNTAELSGVGETILYILQELRKPAPPNLTKIVLRPDSEYAENSVRGLTRPTDNAEMIAEIRRHFKDLSSLCTERNIAFEWSHVQAHDERRWNCRADELAKEYASPNKTASKRALERNSRTPVIDARGLFLGRPAPIRLPEFVVPCDNQPVLNHADVPQGTNLFVHYGSTALHRIPAEHIGILCDLLATKKILRSRSAKKVRECFNFVLDQLKKENNSQDSLWWRKTLLLSRVLFTPTSTDCGLTLTDRCNLVLSNDWSYFTFDSFLRRKFAAPGPKEASAHDKMRETISSNYLKDGEISRGYKALQSNNNPVPLPEDVFRKIRDLHPPRNAAMPDLPENLPDMELTHDEVKATIKGTKNSVTNCPITSLRFELLRLLIGRSSDADEHQFLDSITWMMNIIADGNVPPDIAMILRSTQAVAIPKKDDNIRPLGLRDGFVNLTSKCILKHLQKETFEIFEGLNYALAGPKKMDELIALIAHAFRIKPDHDRLFIDCINAFNQVDRTEAARAIIETCPRLAKYYYFLYQEDTNIWIRSDEETWSTIPGSQGGIQGCVLAPIVYGFGSLIPYKNIESLLKSKENAVFGAFLDDSAISAAHEDTVAAFKLYQAEGPKHGLEINYGPNKTVVLLGKCADVEECQQRIIAYVECGVPASNIKVHPDNGGHPLDYGYIHLGVPVGSKEYQHEHLHSLVDKFIDVGKCDEVVKEAQAKWVYLLWVVRQKFPFWFRHMCPSITSTVEAKIEAHMRSKFDTILGQPTDDLEWTQACLPTKTHGCGLGRPTDIIAAAFAANVEETMDAIKAKLPATAAYLDLLRSPTEIFDAHDFTSNEIMLFVRNAREKKSIVTEAVTALEELPLLRAHDANPSASKRKTQHFYSDFINRHRAKEMEDLMIDHGSDIDKARFLSTNGSFAGAWLFNIPKDKHSTMTSPEFRVALKMRLGVKFHNLLPNCCCSNRTPICHNAVHLFSCNEMKPLIQMRHNAIQHDFLQMGQYGGKRVIDSGLGRMIENDGRKADLLFAGMGRNNTDLAVDFTVGNPCAPSYLPRSKDIANHTLDLLETNKITKYEAAYRAVGVDFKPLAMEMFGAVSDTFISFFKALALAAADANDMPYCIMYAYWQKRVSTTMQKYNAKILHLSQHKIARVMGLVGDDDLDLSARVLNERHIYDAA